MKKSIILRYEEVYHFHLSVSISPQFGTQNTGPPDSQRNLGSAPVSLITNPPAGQKDTGKQLLVASQRLSVGI